MIKKWTELLLYISDKENPDHVTRINLLYFLVLSRDIWVCVWSEDPQLLTLEFNLLIQYWLCINLISL